MLAPEEGVRPVTLRASLLDVSLRLARALLSTRHRALRVEGVSRVALTLGRTPRRETGRLDRTPARVDPRTARDARARATGASKRGVPTEAASDEKMSFITVSHKHERAVARSHSSYLPRSASDEKMSFIKTLRITQALCASGGAEGARASGSGRRGRTGTGEMSGCLTRLPRGRVYLVYFAASAAFGSSHAARGEQSHRDEQREQGVSIQRYVFTCASATRSRRPLNAEERWPSPWA